MTHYSYYQSPIGLLKLTFDHSALCRIEITNENVQCRPVPGPIPQYINTVHKWLDSYFAGTPEDSSSISLKLDGTPFQRTVWRHLQDIPYGQYTTYGQIAKTIAKELGVPKMSAQAVGQAVGKNPLLILIPCHRVLGSNQKLTGFSAGIEVKKQLLDHEIIPYADR